MKKLSICLLVLLVSAVGCASSPPARFYLLNPAAGGQEPHPEQQAAEQIGLQVQVPDYLDRPQIVVREGENRLSLSELDRWAEPLSRMITRVLSQELAAGPSPVRVNTPGSSEDDMRIWVQILRLDGKPRGRVHLSADWRIASTRMDNAQSDSFSTTVPAPAQDMDSLVQAHEQAIQELAANLREALSRTR
ncbi:PqiC family protein [Desulfovermiculus halophilus]|uniref:PqiC family protein n=1 Tax=Desulfovermiculus halophilus TaxID=339722 RepID=UPI0006885B5D|nr:PqiC family protein [Desulfovermiculus halophilus]